MQITAQMVKELRMRTGAGMMDCKKALNETDGDLDGAAELMRKTGLAKADKKADRVAAEGIVAVKLTDSGDKAVMVEVNCETDFVARGDDFQAFADDIAACVLANDPADFDALLSASLASGATVEHTRKELIARIGENMSVRRFVVVDTAGDGHIGVYRHGNRIGVLVHVTGGDEELGKDLAMHVAASRPSVVNQSEVSAELVEKEKEIFSAQAAESGKPENIIEKMVGGRIRKFLDEQALVGQPFVKDPAMQVSKLLDSKGAAVVSFQRLEVGEGIEKKVDDFAAEVKAQAGG